LVSFDAKPFNFSFATKNIKIIIYRTIILPVVLCGYETWSLILREEHKFRVLQNMVLREIFVSKGDEGARE
jgi:hypothetical protein